MRCSTLIASQPDSDNTTGESVQDPTGTNFAISELAILTFVLQATGVFVLVTSLATFIKNRLLQKKEHAYHVCLLVSEAMLLMFDWTIFMSGYSRCDVFSMTFILFGSANTLSSLAIASDRFRRMSLGYSSSQGKAHYVTGVILIWTMSLSTIALPLYGYIHTDHHGRKPETSSYALCLLQNGRMYSTFGPSLYFTIVSNVVPTLGILVCYICVFRSVKNARISRWINQAAAAANRKANIIQTNGRKANIVAIPNNLHRTASRGRHHLTNQQSRSEAWTSSQERSILLKAGISLCLVIFWFPFTGFWLYTSISGFKTSCIFQFRMLILLAKLSSVLRIGHYIIFNPRYKNLYLQLVCCCPCKHRIGVHNSNQPNSQVGSNVDTMLSRTERVWSVRELPDCTHNAGMGTLDTIREVTTRPCDQQAEISVSD